MLFVWLVWWIVLLAAMVCCFGCLIVVGIFYCLKIVGCFAVAGCSGGA